MPANDTAPSGDNRTFKYHVLRFGDSFYLTTNPTIKHVYCTHAPSLFAHVSGPRLALSAYDSDHTLDPRTLLFVEKDLLSRGGNLIVTIPLPTSHGIERKHCAPMLDCKIHPAYHDISFPNLQYTDQKRRAWNVGAIPQFRDKPSRIRTARNAVRSVQRDTRKLINYKNVYLYPKGAATDCDLESIASNRFPPTVAAMFRPCESTLRNRISHTASKLKRTLKAVDDRLKSDRPQSSDYVADDDQPHREKYGWISIYHHGAKRDHADELCLLVLHAGLVLAASLDFSNKFPTP